MKRFFISLFLFFTLVISNSTQAQILNVEKFQAKVGDSTRWFSQMAFNGTLTQIQRSVYELNQKTFTALKQDRMRYLLLSDINLVIVDNDKVISNGYVHFRSVFEKSKKIAFEAFFQEQFDAVRGLKRRDVQGLDVRFNLANTKRISLDLATGFMHEYEWWQNTTQLETRRFIKSTTSLLLAIPFSSQFQFHSTGYYQFVPDKPMRPRLIFDSRISWSLTERFQLALSENIFYDANPIIDIDKWVHKLHIELVVSF